MVRHYLEQVDLEKFNLRDRELSCQLRRFSTRASFLAIMADRRPQIVNTVHFVGSICLPDATTVFSQLCTSLPGRLRRIPDGETGRRQRFVYFQHQVFADCPFVLLPRFPIATESFEPPSPGAVKLRAIEYDDHALSSYTVFSKLRAEGVIPPNIRFEVSLPTPINVLGNLIEPAWRSTVEPIYEAAFLTALRRNTRQHSGRRSCDSAGHRHRVRIS